MTRCKQHIGSFEILGLSASCLVILSGSCLAGAEEDPFSEQYFFGDIPIVLSATRLSQPLSETPAAMTIIDKQMIQASGALEIPDLMQMVPGMQVINYVGSKYFVTYHGRSDRFARDLQVLVDGRSVYDPIFGGVSWSDLPLAIEDINRIEVIRGPNAATYGSNSFAGVVNIITEHPAQQQGTLVKATTGSDNSHQILMRHAGSFDDFDYRLTVNYDENEGLDNRPDDNLTRWLEFRGDYQVNPNTAITFKMGHTSGSQDDGFSNTDSFQIPRGTSSTQSFQQLRWTHLADSGSEYSLQLFHNKQTLDDRVFWPANPDIPVDSIIGLSFESRRYEL